MGFELLLGNEGQTVGPAEAPMQVHRILLGQGIAPLEAAAVGAWLHGGAGDLCASEMGQYGMLPTDMLTRLPRLMK